MGALQGGVQLAVRCMGLPDGRFSAGIGGRLLPYLKPQTQASGLGRGGLGDTAGPAARGGKVGTQEPERGGKGTRDGTNPACDGRREEEITRRGWRVFVRKRGR
ncbi:hypothetical protein NDU88_004374 [Pleurodeles waltl]|uniref:Uncharacterized protein n=1 Tax=Pleurodeles waltl TaxID=8319 RepID=A0AAV7KY79_PLEWA|nr:hypothetical protein NDU88_004374 [Pleurodeles waltl]